SFRHAVFEHVFKNKISQTVNLESSKTEIISWKSSEEIVAKKVFGQQPTKNQYAVTRSILHNLFNPEIVKIKFDEKYLTRKLQSFLV
ncbi:15758_t:CDS:2, partial [Cetraspora pellucida]